MSRFLELEGAYLIVALFIIAVTLFVSTRPFVSEGGKGWRQAVPIISLLMFGFIFAHFYMTTQRMEGVKEQFNNGGLILCESRSAQKIERAMLIDPAKDGWKLDGDIFRSSMHDRVFHSARCYKYNQPPK
ncbi:MAG: hypothetical protein U9N30_04575 [Campylobacterota bacterium]|nr:hypothetical protein [Campylobacterota bacterium]